MFPLMVCILTLVSLSLTTAQNKCVERQIATFNTGLTPSIPDYSRRRQLVAGELANLAADVICLQEVWFESDIKLILNNVGHVFPHTWSALHYSTTQMDRPTSGFWSVLARHRDKVGSMPCSRESSSSFVWCVLTKCAGNTGSVFVCVLQQCARFVFTLSQDCLTCMAVAGNEIETVGSVVCTHLSGSLDAIGGLHIEAQIQAVLGITSWERQQKYEIKKIISQFSGPHMLVGDLNTGPEIQKTSVGGEFPGNYGLLEIAGYRDDYVTRVGACTFCAGNPLRTSTSNTILDHVLVNGLYTLVSSKRILLSTAAGEPLSDHYGVQVGICNEY